MQILLFAVPGPQAAVGPSQHVATGRQAGDRNLTLLPRGNRGDGVWSTAHAPVHQQCFLASFGRWERQPGARRPFRAAVFPRVAASEPDDREKRDSPDGAGQA